MSDLVRRISLPAGDVDFMPKNGKTALTSQEIAAIVWWVSVGAPNKGTLAELNAPDSVRETVSAVLGLSGHAPAQAATTTAEPSGTQG